MKILERNGYKINFWKYNENFRKYLRKNHIDFYLTPDNLLSKHYEVYEKLTDIEKYFKR